MTKNLIKSFKNLVTTLWLIKDEGDFENFLNDILTQQEILELSERIEILKLLKSGKTQRDIAKKLGVSVTTVNRGSKVLQNDPTTLEKILGF